MTENWLPIPGYEGRYDVSNWGRVYSRISAKILSPGHTREGYRQVFLYGPPNTGRMRKIAHLVLQAFIGPCPPGQECLHGPGGVADDSLDNLSWGTKSKNQGADRARDGTSNRGERNGGAKLTCEQARAVKQLAATGTLTYEEIGTMFGISKAQVSLIKTGKRWKDA